MRQMATTKKKIAAKRKPAAVKKPPVKAAPPPPPPPAPPPIDHVARIGELWRRLGAHVAMIGAPPLGLEAGASEKAIAAAEKTMKLVFPPDFRASLRLHDGQAAGSFPWMPGCAPLAPLARILEEWENQQRLAAKAKPVKGPIDEHARLKPGVHRTGRVPIAGNALLDLDPGPAGTPGQLIALVSKVDLVVIDTSFGAALERWVSVLERGIWVYDAEKRAALPKAAPLFVGNPAGLFSKR